MASARSGEPDRYLAALLAPPPARADLLALAAFASELARVPALVTREPAMGEIRLQWWREALAASGASARTGNPIADALRAAMRRHDLPARLLLDTIDAREVDLARQALPDDAALASYLWKSEGALFALAASILGRDPGVDMQAAAVAVQEEHHAPRIRLAEVQCRKCRTVDFDAAFNDALDGEPVLRRKAGRREQQAFLLPVKQEQHAAIKGGRDQDEREHTAPPRSRRRVGRQ